MNKLRLHPCRHTRPSRGFTLIELLVVVTMVSILLAVAVPSFRTMIINSQVSSLGNEFVMGATYARSQAIAQNKCVTMCISTDPQADTPTCAAAGTEWNKGWIIFTNPKCDSNASDSTAELLKMYIGEPNGPTLTPSAGTYRTLRFDSRGMTSIAAARELRIAPAGEAYTKIVCVDSAGRTRMANWDSTVCSDSSN